MEGSKTIFSSGCSPTPLQGRDDADPNLLGTILAERYYVVAEIGSGGMGLVYLAEHIDLHRHFAIKVPRFKVGSSGRIADLFLCEARIAALIRHPNVVAVTDFGRAEDGMPFLVMEHLEGEDLSATIARDGPMPWSQVQTIMLQILGALEAAHGVGVIHRDITPSNCFCAQSRSGDTVIKVLDFGVAETFGDNNACHDLTHRRGVVGTRRYMSPEQANGEETDIRTDIYSAGMVAIELLTGRDPLAVREPLGENLPRLHEDISTSMLTRLSEVSTAVEAVIGRSVAKEREERYPTAREFAQAILDLPPDTALVRSGSGYFR